jgi:alkane 1-monooxygenase
MAKQLSFFWRFQGKYLLAFVVAFLPLMGLYLRGAWSFLTPVIIFGLLPLLELFMPGTEENLSEGEEVQAKKNRFFDWLLYLNLPLLYGILLYYFWLISHVDLSLIEWMGLSFSVGIACGALGINVGHELGHRVKKSEQLIAQMLLLGSLYMHFFIEHNRGHHRHVATPKDPASSFKGETVYAFWLRSMLGGYRSAWRLERSRLAKKELPFWSWHNQMLRFQLIQLAALSLVGLAFGPKAMLAYLLVALLGALLLETVNYLEHYGLRRKEIRPGVYEPVKPHHSWNSNHSLGRIILFELTRHSDHHYRASRKYQILRHHEVSPELPTGYPGMMLLALLPPVWFRVMHPHLKAQEAQLALQIQK